MIFKVCPRVCFVPLGCLVRSVPVSSWGQEVSRAGFLSRGLPDTTDRNVWRVLMAASELFTDWTHQLITQEDGSHGSMRSPQTPKCCSEERTAYPRGVWVSAPVLTQRGWSSSCLDNKLQVSFSLTQNSHCIYLLSKPLFFSFGWVGSSLLRGGFL